MKLFTILLASLLMSTYAAAEVVVVVGAKSTVASLTKDQLAGIYLGKDNKFPDGSLAVPIDQTAGNTVRDEFHSEVTKKNSAQLKSFWSKQVFSGKGNPPKEVASSADVKKLVATNPNMLGYIEKSAVDGTVKVVLGL